MTDEEQNGTRDPDLADDAELEDGSQESQNRRARRAAAAKARKARVRERKEAAAIGLDAQEMIDDAVARSTDSAAKWFRRNAQRVQWAIVIGLAGWAGWGLLNYRAARVDAEATDLLAKGLRIEAGRVGEKDEQADDRQGITDPTPVFETDEERLKAAEAALASAKEYGEGKGTHAYAELAYAAVLFDQGKFDEAKAAYEAVKNSKQAASLPEVMGLALDGIGVTLQAKDDKQGALAVYQELEAKGISGFKEQALLQQTRLHLGLGDRDAAKQALKKLNELAGPPTSAAPTNYLEASAKILTQELDPEAIQQAPPAPITPERLKELQEQMQRSINAKMQKTPEQPSAPGAPPASGAPAPKLQLKLGSAAPLTATGEPVSPSSSSSTQPVSAPVGSAP